LKGRSGLTADSSAALRNDKQKDNGQDKGNSNRYLRDETSGAEERQRQLREVAWRFTSALGGETAKDGAPGYRRCCLKYVRTTFFPTKMAKKFKD
jgi:hypothetical protein